MCWLMGCVNPGTGGGNIRIDPWPRSPIPRLPIPLPWPWPRDPFPRRRRGPFTITSLTSSTPSVAGNAAAARSSRRHRGGDYMTDIAAAGGGPVYDAQRISDMPRLAYRIAEELRHVYVLSYYPSKPLSAGGYRSIRISVKSRDDIAVRHRKGYNAGTANASSSAH
jgi:Ca-activated chloride channel homolog